MKNQVQLSDHFTYKRLFRFTLPSIVMMVFTSIYGVVDGFFVSNFVGKTPFAAVNLIYPFIMILSSIGFMFGSGGSALIAKTLGEGDKTKANKQFSLIVFTSITLGVLFAIPGIIFMPEIATLFKAEGAIHADCVIYGRILLISLPSLILQFEFQTFFVTAEKPTLGLTTTVITGVMNMVLDALFMAVFRWGITGAAVATAISQLIGGVLPLIYFLRKNNSLLRLCKPKFEWNTLIRSSTNGISEFLSNVSASFVCILYNLQLYSFAGEDGVAAYGVLMYVNFVFVSVLIGYSVGVAPVFSFNLGAKNAKELKNVLRKSLYVISLCSLSMVALAQGLAFPLSKMFVSYDQTLFEITLRAFKIFSFSFLFSGLAIFGSSFFTALNNGLISAIISFLRTLVFQVVAILILPIYFELDGIWLSGVVAEFSAFFVSALCIILNRKKYNY